MNHYDLEVRAKHAEAQTRTSGAIRDEANALIAGRSHPALEDPTISRISDSEMKGLSGYSRDWEREDTGSLTDGPRGSV